MINAITWYFFWFHFWIRSDDLKCNGKYKSVSGIPFEFRLFPENEKKKEWQSRMQSLFNPRGGVTWAIKQQGGSMERVFHSDE